VFTLVVNNIAMRTNLDIFATVGCNTALIGSLNTNSPTDAIGVTNSDASGVITIEMKADIGNT